MGPITTVSFVGCGRPRARMVPAPGHRRSLAEGVGFEPTVACATHAFQACRIGRSRNPPGTREATLGGRTLSQGAVGPSATGGRGPRRDPARNTPAPCPATPAPPRRGGAGTPPRGLIGRADFDGLPVPLPA